MSAQARAEVCDWTQDRRVSWLWPAAFALVGTGWLAVADPAGSLLAATGFAVAGALCVGNAVHCRRAHCVVTGPLYLVAAILFVARVAGAAVPGGLIVAGSIAGTIVAHVPEWLGTRYLRRTADASSVATTGTLLAAVLVGACCLGPSLFMLFGVSVAALGSLGALEPYRVPFLAGGLACWAVAYRARRRARCEPEMGGTPDRRSPSGVLLWVSLVALIAASVYPYLVARLAIT